MSEERMKKPFISESDKRDLMWNIVEPGDPYDIRKSMIAKLPGEKKFMGPHLEIICLLQAAEIQRLCLFLEQYQVKLRQSQRVQLDRHSYQVQIKELSDRLANQQNIKTENDKLKEFIRRQAIEVQNLQKQQQNLQLSKKYQNSLRQIQIMYQQKQDLKEDTYQLNNQIKNLKDLLKNNQQRKIKQFQTLNQEIEQSHERQLAQDQKNREYFNRWESDRKNLERQMSLLNKKYQQLQNINKNIKTQSQKYKIEASKNQQFIYTIKQYENRFQLLAQQIERLNVVLKDKSKLLNEEYIKSKQLTQFNRQKDEEITEFEKRIHQLEQTNSKLQKENRQNSISFDKLQQNKVIIQSYQASLEKFSIEVDRLNNILRKKMAQVDQLKKKQVEYQIKTKGLQPIEKQCNEYKYKLNDAHKKLILFQRQTGELSLELDRVNNSLKRVIEELNQTKNHNQLYEKEIYVLRKHIQQLKVQLQEQKSKRQNENVKITLKRSDGKKKEYIPEIPIYSESGYKLSPQQGNNPYKNQQYVQDENMPRQRQSASNDKKYIEQLMKKIRRVEVDLQQEKEETQRLRGIVKSQNKEEWGFEQRQTILKQSRQIERLKDQLLDKQIYINRLSEINQKLRETFKGNDNEQKEQQENWKQYRGQENYNKQEESIQNKKLKDYENVNNVQALSGIENNVNKKYKGYQIEDPYNAQGAQYGKERVRPKEYQAQGAQYGKERVRPKEYQAQGAQYGKERVRPKEYQAQGAQYGKERVRPKEYQAQGAQYGKERVRPKEYQAQGAQYGKERVRPKEYQAQGAQYGKERVRPKEYQAQGAQYGKERVRPKEYQAQGAQYGKERVRPKEYQAQGAQYGKERVRPKEYQTQGAQYGKERVRPKEYQAQGAQYGKERVRPKEYQAQGAQYGKERVRPKEYQAQGAQYGKERVRPKEYQAQGAQYGKERVRPKEYQAQGAQYGKERVRPKEYQALDVYVKDKILIKDFQEQASQYPLSSYCQPQLQKQPQSSFHSPQQSFPSTYKPFYPSNPNHYQAEYYNILKDYQRLTDINQQLKLKIFNLQQQSQKLLYQWSLKLNLLQQQNKQYRSQLDPTIVQRIQQDTNLKRQYSILLHKYNEITYENQLLHRQIGSKQPNTKPIILYNSQDLQQLINQNQQLKKKCSQLDLFHHKIISVNEELQRLGLIIQAKDKDILSKQMKIQQYQRKNVELQNQPSNQQISKLQKRNAQLEKIIKQYELNQSSYRLDRQDEKQKVLNKQKIQSYEIAHEQPPFGKWYKDQKQKNKFQTNSIENIQNNTNSLQLQESGYNRQVQDEKRFSKMGSNQKKSISNYEDKIVLLSQQIERLNGLLTARAQKYKQLQNQFNQYKQDQRNNSQTLKNKKYQKIQTQQRLKPENIDQTKIPQTQNLYKYQTKLLQLGQQIDRLNRILSYSKEKNEQFQNKQKKYISEIQRLNNSLRLKVQESILNESREKSYEQQKQYLLRQIQESKNIVSESIVQRYEIYGDKYEIRVKGLYEEIQRLQKVITNLKGDNFQYSNNQEIKQLIEKNRFLISEIQRINEIQSLQNQDLQNLRLNYTDSIALDKRIKEHLSLFVILFAEIQSLRNRVQQGERELVKVRRQNVIARKV